MLIITLHYFILVAKMQKKSLDTSPDEVRKFEDGKIEPAIVGDVTIGGAD